MKFTVFIVISCAASVLVGCGQFESASTFHPVDLPLNQQSVFTPQSSDVASISGNVFGSPLTISASQRTAGAIDSVVWQGKQFINATDHGRELQSASSFDGFGECLNPTEAGSANDAGGGASTSRLLGVNTSGNQLRTTIQMAYWLAAGQSYSQGCGGQNARFSAVNSSNLSNDSLSKQVTIGYAGMENVVEYLVSFHVTDAHSNATFEALTGYMPNDFSSFYLVNLNNSALMSTNHTAGEQDKPVILATADQRFAMGIYSPELPDGPFGYGKFAFPDTVKWNAVFRRTNVKPGDFSFRLYVVVGNLEQVRSSIVNLNHKFHPTRTVASLPPPPPVKTLPVAAAVLAPPTPLAPSAPPSLPPTTINSNVSKTPIYRFYAPSSGEHFYTASSAEGYGAGMMLEGVGFYVLSSQVAGSVPIYRCYFTKHFVSNSSSCEGTRSEGVYGYIYTSAQPGTLPLYRGYSPGSQDHLNLFSSAFPSSYVVEGLMGFVPQ